MRRRVVVAGLVMATTMLAACLPPQGGHWNRTFDRATTAQLRALADAVVGQGVPGVGVVVQVGDKRFEYVTGKADIDTGRPLRRRDHVRIASVTKTFTATAVLQLVDKGRLSLDQTVDDFVPGMPNGNATVRDLLDMRSGIFNFVEDPGFQHAFDQDPDLPWTPAQSLAIARSNPTYFEPGEGFHYSETNYTILGLIVEQLTGKPIDRVINQRVVAAAGLGETNYPRRSTVPDPSARGYLPQPDGSLRRVDRINPQVAGPAGAITSTLDDLVRWGRVLADGTLLSPELQAERTATIPFGTGPGLELSYGLGLLNINGFLGHNGAIYGYGTALFRDPARDATVAIVSNRATNDLEPTTALFVQIVRLLFPEQFPTP